jgi:hypothetical protein
MTLFITELQALFSINLYRLSIVIFHTTASLAKPGQLKTHVP